MPHHESVKDPVCGMTCDVDTSKWKSDYEGKTYHFCAKGCKDTFDKNPKKYTK